MNVQILPTISTFFIVLSAILVAIGWWLIAKKNIKAHKRVMFFAAVFATLFFIIYVSRTLFIGNTSFGGPEEIKNYYTAFLFFHIFLATSGAVFGIVTLVSAYSNNLVKHKKLGPITSVVWFFTASTGTVVYILLYVLYPGGATTSVFKAILGF